MFGAYIGDVVGSIYEFDNIKTKEFELFSDECFYTDDSLLTYAIGRALLNVKPTDDGREIKRIIIAFMRKYCLRETYHSYGAKFRDWLNQFDPQPYNSYGNGSAMRVSACGWLYDDIFTTRYMARLTAEVSHNHIEGIKGAEAVASAIYLARNGKNKSLIADYITEEFGYNLNFTCDSIRSTYQFNESCQGTVPQAIVCFLEGFDFEDCIRNAISIGGDSDTLAAITGSIAEAYYGVPQELKDKVRAYIPDSFVQLAEQISANQ